MTNQDNILTVSELSSIIKYSLETLIGFVNVKGEISGLKSHPSGHLYFSLIDNSSTIHAVCWSSNKQNIKKINTISNGIVVICKGMTTSYKSASRYQISIVSIEIYEEGKIDKQIAEKKILFEKNGFFANNRKINRTPEKLCVITSKVGAVISDIKKSLKERYCPELIILHSNMQGKNCSHSLSKTIEFINKDLSDTDTIIIARGGGSNTDLSEFNEERLIKAIYNSKIPVISAIGHETDNLLCDLAADQRASTPTAAAAIAAMEIKSITDSLENSKALLMTTASSIVNSYYLQIYKFFELLKKNEMQIKEKAIKKPDNTILTKAIEIKIDQCNALIPSKDLLNKKISDLHTAIIKYFYIAHHHTNIKFNDNQKTINQLYPLIPHKSFFGVENTLKYLISSILSLNKNSTLKRGYALITDDASGKILSSANEMYLSNKITVNFRDGKCKIMI